MCCLLRLFRGTKGFGGPCGMTWHNLRLSRELVPEGLARRRMSRQRIVVLKLGGSVLVDESCYAEAARFLARRLQTRNEERLVVVVSARKGITDELERHARDTTLYPNLRTLDLLWSTGELHSVALLTLHLEELRFSTVRLNIHETGLRLNGNDQ